MNRRPHFVPLETPPGSTVGLGEPDEVSDDGERRRERLALVVTLLTCEVHLLGTAVTVGTDKVARVNEAGEKKVAMAEALADFVLARVGNHNGENP